MSLFELFVFLEVETAIGWSIHITNNLGQSGHCRVKHLEFIQAVIARLANNSFAYKGWVVVLVAGVFVVTGGSVNVLIAVLPLLAFWGLDGYYLRQERFDSMPIQQRITLVVPARQVEGVREGYDENEKIARGELSHRGQFSCAGLAARRCNFPLPTLPCPVIESSPRAKNILPRRALAYTSPVSDQQRIDSEEITKKARTKLKETERNPGGGRVL